MRHGHLTAISALLVFSTSCSWYRNLERSLVEDEEKNQKKSRVVPREQYDQLLVKYEELSKKYEDIKENPNAGKPSIMDDVQTGQGENFSQGTETVDVFAGQAPAADAAAGPIGNISQDLEAQITLFRKAMTLKTANPGEATKIFQQLENQGGPSIKVRAKLQIGELLLGRGQYDLALQVFEDIINKNSYSGVVIDALKFGVVCADKLGIQNKKEQFASMLNDVFESN